MTSAFRNCWDHLLLGVALLGLLGGVPSLQAGQQPATPRGTPTIDDVAVDVEPEFIEELRVVVKAVPRGQRQGKLAAGEPTRLLLRIPENVEPLVLSDAEFSFEAALKRLAERLKEKSKTPGKVRVSLECDGDLKGLYFLRVFETVQAAGFKEMGLIPPPEPQPGPRRTWPPEEWAWTLDIQAQPGKRDQLRKGDPAQLALRGVGNAKPEQIGAQRTTAAAKLTDLEARLRELRRKEPDRFFLMVSVKGFLRKEVQEQIQTFGKQAGFPVVAVALPPWRPSRPLVGPPAPGWDDWESAFASGVVSDPLTITDIDPAALEPDVDIQFNTERKAEISVPGVVDPTAPIGISNGDKVPPPGQLPPPPGSEQIGPGVGGGLIGLPPRKPGVPDFTGRSGATREKGLIELGGTKGSEAAVVAGLKWLLRVQESDGRWRLDGNFQNKGTANDTAGTAFGLLSFFGAGKTHKATKDNPDARAIERGMLFLLRKQDKRTGDLGGGMYAHALATIALCEAYHLTQDPVLRRPAQQALNYLLSAQHPEGGWRYAPGQAGDTSVTSWVVLALRTGQAAGLDVSDNALRKVVRYLDSACTQSEGYSYVAQSGGSAAMAAAGLLCRQHPQGWGPTNARLIKGINANLKPVPPGKTRNMYYYHYATQVMFHLGGQTWKEWNQQMRDSLLQRQEQEDAAGSPLKGSWSPVGDVHGSIGGRLMETALCLRTLAIYYRHVPMHRVSQAAGREQN